MPCQIFAKNNLKITADANKKVVNFLDVTLDLNTGKFKPYSKPPTTRFTFTANRTTHSTSSQTYPKQLTSVHSLMGKSYFMNWNCLTCRPVNKTSLLSVQGKICWYCFTVSVLLFYVKCVGYMPIFYND